MIISEWILEIGDRRPGSEEQRPGGGERRRETNKKKPLSAKFCVLRLPISGSTQVTGHMAPENKERGTENGARKALGRKNARGNL